MFLITFSLIILYRFTETLFFTFFSLSFLFQIHGNAHSCIMQNLFTLENLLPIMQAHFLYELPLLGNFEVGEH